MIPRYSRPKMADIFSEKTRFNKWLDVELAVCEARKELGELNEKVYEKIKGKAEIDIEQIQQREAETHHELVAFLDVLQKNIGKESRFIHLGMTSSDVMDTAMSLQLVDACSVLEDDLSKTMAAIKRVAEKYKYTPIIGRTHGMHAEPTTFGLKMAVFFSEFKRHATRFEAARKNTSVGKISGAVGNYAQIDPEIERIALEKLGLERADISTQIIQRDRYAEFVAVCGLIAATCEKIATEVRNLQRTEINEVEEPFALKQKGSSAMPHKRNPVKCEQVCGLSRIVRSAVIPALENVTLWHERDISHSSAERVILPDVCITLDYILDRITLIIDGLEVFPEKMLENINLTHGLVFSQRLMLRLVSSGMSREKAHTMVQGKAMAAIMKKNDFREEVIKDGEIRRYLTLEEIEAMFDLDIYIRHVDDIFKRVFGV